MRRMDFANHIFLPTDFSDSSDHALDAAIVLANQLGTKVTLFHAFDAQALVPPLSIDPVAYRANIEKEVRGAVQAKLDELRTTKLAALSDVETLIGTEPGVPRSICDHAKAVGADLIVMATHGRTALKSMLIGSVAEKVVRHAHCPVLVVRAQAS
jgi:nucleotide-binding universal stress UspA family protein